MRISRRPERQSAISHPRSARPVWARVARTALRLVTWDGWSSPLEFTHHTSRRTPFPVEDGEIRISPNASAPGDPDLHTHFLIPNAVFCESGRVGSLDTAAIGGFI